MINNRNQSRDDDLRQKKITGKCEYIRFSEEPLSLMRETLHNVQGMKAHSEIQFSLDSENLKDCCP